MKRFANYADQYLPDSSTAIRTYRCGICNAEMDLKEKKVQRCGKYSGNPIPGEFYDFYECPNCREQWHCQLKQLWKLHDALPSWNLRNLVEGEIQFILLHKTKTLEDKDFPIDLFVNEIQD